jgi:hypothetical protein
VGQHIGATVRGLEHFELFELFKSFKPFKFVQAAE